FDQFDEAPAAQAAGANFFDQFAAPAAVTTTQAPRPSTRISPDGGMTVGVAQENPTGKAAAPEATTEQKIVASARIGAL
ncbi:hypothetical protein LLE87_38505, partial [Paenibacillus polymyxa]|nr:hypothetical protein [Paenibacillus polymyxa]